MNAQVLVIGHTGFIGKSIVEYLNLKKIKFVGVASKECDLRKSKSSSYLAKLFTKNTTLIVTAAINRELGDTVTNMHTHIKMIANIAKALQISPIRKCVYLSTTDVYGKSNKLPITELTPLGPKTYYAIAKYCSENILQIIARNTRLPLLIFRYNGVFGPGQKNIGYGPNFFIKSILEEGVVKLWGNGQELRDTVYVKDLTRIIVELSFKNSTGIYNIATGRSRSFIEMINMLKEITPKKFKIVKSKRTTPIFNQTFDISNIKRQLEISFTPMDKALAETLKSF